MVNKLIIKSIPLIFRYGSHTEDTISLFSLRRLDGQQIDH